MGKKKIGCSFLGCSIPLITFIIILVAIIALSVYGFTKGGFAHSADQTKAFISSLEVSLPAEVMFHLGPLPVTNTIITSWITMAILLIIALCVTRKPKLIPGKMQSLMEFIIEWLYNFCKDTAGEKNGRRFFPLVSTIFLFIFVNALMNLIPGYNSLTYHGSHLLRGANTDINTAFALASISFVSFTFWGIQANKFSFFKQFFNFGKFFEGWGQVFKGKAKAGCGGIFFGLIDIVVGFLELLSYFIRLISFTFRLFGNMLGGEILVLVFTFLLVFAGFGIIPIIYSFEIVLSVSIQALIFAGLTLVFSTMAVSSHESEEEETKGHK